MRSLTLVGCLSLLLSSPLCAHRVHQVPGDFASLQTAIDAAAAGDSILVAAGTYRECIAFRGRPLLLLSRSGAAQTVIDGSGCGTVVSFDQGEDVDSVLDGFTITGGSHPTDAGGVHIVRSSPTLRNNVIRGNIGGRRGHGVSLLASPAAVIEHNLISDNTSFALGNGAGGGGGIGVEGPGAVEILGNRIEGNRVSRFSSGGGIHLLNAGATRIIGNRIEGNRARLSGGGIAIYGSSSARIENNLIVGNALSEPGQGGGVQWLLMSGATAPELIGNTLVDNVARFGSGIHADGYDQHARIINNLVLAPSGMTAIECGDFGDLMPPELRHNNALAGSGAYVGLCEPSASDVRRGNRSQPPLFAPGSWRLAPGSPGIDAGDALASGETLDLDGRARLTDGNGDGKPEIDIGALETPEAGDQAQD